MEKRKRGSRTRASRAPAAITIEFDLPSSRLTETIYATLLPETLSQPRGFRSHAAVKKKERGVALMIEADDIVALRASSNTYLRFIQVALKTVEAVHPFIGQRVENRSNSKNLGNEN